MGDAQKLMVFLRENHGKSPSINGGRLGDWGYPHFGKPPHKAEIQMCKCAPQQRWRVNNSLQGGISIKRVSQWGMQLPFIRVWQKPCRCGWKWNTQRLKKQSHYPITVSSDNAWDARVQGWNNMCPCNTIRLDDYYMGPHSIPRFNDFFSHEKGHFSNYQ